MATRLPRHAQALQADSVHVHCLKCAGKQTDAAYMHVNVCQSAVTVYTDLGNALRDSSLRLLSLEQHSRTHVHAWQPSQERHAASRSVEYKLGAVPA